MKKLYISQVFAIIIAIISIGFLSISHMNTVAYERDEVSWYFHTKFFDEAFIQKNIHSPIWDGYESFDHPQISKYIYGAYLYAYSHDYARTRNMLEKKYGRWDFYYAIKSDTDISNTEFAPILSELRKINIMFTFLILGEIVILFYMLSRSFIFSFLVSLIFSLNDLFMSSLTKITSDNHMLFFGLLAMILYMRSIKSKRWSWVVGASIATALCVGAKLTGIFLFVSVLLNEIIRLTYTKMSFEKNLKRIGLYGILTFSVWVLINPSLYRSPLKNTWRYFSFRNFQSTNIAYHMPEVALPTISEKIQAATCTLVIRSCNRHSAAGSLTPLSMVNVILLGVGLVYFYVEMRKRNEYIIFLTASLYIFSMGFLVYLSNYSSRYFLFLQVIVFFIQVFGVWSLVMYVKRKISFLTVRRALRK